eukprot:CAMPEP_0174384062 /NCGR_PEP_ID=MMETSP0811_2-20130205/125664_1 /TAXON_ID=73025 ORGANISM="Eutreptiella gymnastica-like, Strain CCMP1594" /NCGR_SAMPLE_ID=MMETSP0811_2 /ASSEMBLY_ACC=CAM_ASM_000667 /LENGTH=99 /DNA_ID=CAMNT_0015537885 /DNA_START=535 /DNA_END=834 /DNA_ORIENTATION=-
MGQAGRRGSQGGERPMVIAAYGGKGLKEKARVSGKRAIGAASFRQQQGGERPMVIAAYGGKGLKEKARVSGKRAIGAASFRQQSTQASCQAPPSMNPLF